MRFWNGEFPEQQHPPGVGVLWEIQFDKKKDDVNVASRMSSALCSWWQLPSISFFFFERGKIKKAHHNPPAM